MRQFIPNINNTITNEEITKLFSIGAKFGINFKSWKCLASSGFRSTVFSKVFLVHSQMNLLVSHS